MKMTDILQTAFSHFSKESYCSLIKFRRGVIVISLFVMINSQNPNHAWATASIFDSSWWRHHMETFSAPLALCAGNSPVTGEFPAQRPVTRSFDVFFDLHLNKQLSKQSWGWWFETPSRSLWRPCNVRTCSWHTRIIIHVTSKYLYF